MTTPAPRKSRKGHLPTSVDHASLEWKLTDEHWTRISKACPFLNENDRTALQAIAAEYMAAVPMERTAPETADAKQWLERLERSAAVFLREANASSPRTPENGALHYAESLVEERLTRFANWRESGWWHVVSAMTDIVVAVQEAKQDIASHDGKSPEGDAWADMVRALTNFAKSRGYKHGAPKDANKSKGTTASPFVTLVSELQFCFPENHRRHGKGFTLAAGINAARAGA